VIVESEAIDDQLPTRVNIKCVYVGVDVVYNCLPGSLLFLDTDNSAIANDL